MNYYSSLATYITVTPVKSVVHTYIDYCVILYIAVRSVFDMLVM